MSKNSQTVLPAGVRKYQLNEMTCGWFVGAFQPVAYSTPDGDPQLFWQQLAALPEELRQSHHLMLCTDHPAKACEIIL